MSISCLALEPMLETWNYEYINVVYMDILYMRYSLEILGFLRKPDLLIGTGIKKKDLYGSVSSPTLIAVTIRVAF